MGSAQGGGVGEGLAARDVVALAGSPSVGFRRIGSGYHPYLGKQEDARLKPSQVGVFRWEWRHVETQAVYIQHQAHHLLLFVSPFGVHPW